MKRVLEKLLEDPNVCSIRSKKNLTPIFKVKLSKTSHISQKNVKNEDIILYRPFRYLQYHSMASPKEGQCQIRLDCDSERVKIQYIYEFE